MATRRVPGGRAYRTAACWWELVFPRGHGFGGTLPFFIDWLAPSIPPAAWSARRLAGSGEHPHATEYERVLLAVAPCPSGSR